MSDAADAKVSFVRTRASRDAVPSDELFFMRETRLDLVGSISRTTTVVDNDPVVPAVASCVSRVVASVTGTFAR